MDNQMDNSILIYQELMQSQMRLSILILDLLEIKEINMFKKDFQLSGLILMSTRMVKSQLIKDQFY